MNKYLVFSLLICAISARAQHAEIAGDQHHLVIKWNGSERLANGDAVMNDTQPVAAGYRIQNDVVLISLLPNHATVRGSAYSGIFFNDLPQLRSSVAMWRYKPWNSWTKPMALAAASKMPSDDVQFYYWQYADNIFGAAVPLNGKGFRTTMGSQGGKWGSKAVTYADAKNIDSIPALAVAFGKDPFELFERIYKTALEAMGKGENRRELKKFPEPFNYIGWCTWNASDNGKNLDEELLLKAAKSFSEARFPIGWMLIDDGWFQDKNRQLQSYQPNVRQFPNGFKPVINQLKHEYGIRYMGVWHTLNGLWNGIDPASTLGTHYASSMFSWTQKERPDLENSPLKKYYFIKPDSDSLNAFYDNWHRYLKNEGFDFVKVDNQLVVEKMAVGNYPIFTLSDSIHKALYRSVNKYFDGAVLNCMDMTAEAYFNFGNTAVARSEEDYFPYEPNETYNLQRGNAAAHVLQAIYNSIYFGQMVYPDFDLFQSHNPNATFHAIARAINCGPIYITDQVGKQDFSILRPLVYSDGRIIKSETPLLPTRDCLFQVQDARLFKASSMVRDAGLLGIWNAADTDMVQGAFKPDDVRSIKGDNFAVYEYFTKKLVTAKRQDSFPVTMKRMGYALYYVVPLRNGFAPFGLADKYNAPATIVKQAWKSKTATVTLYEGGTFIAYCQQAPSTITVNGKRINAFSYQNKKLTVLVPPGKNPAISVTW